MAKVEVVQKGDLYIVTVNGKSEAIAQSLDIGDGIRVDTSIDAPTKYLPPHLTTVVVDRVALKTFTQGGFISD